MDSYSFKIDTRLAVLLSENYRSTERALKELVDNAWDADATLVTIHLPEPMSDLPITIEDDGTGMTPLELQNEYLNIARNRRSRSGDYTLGKKRKVKGRKGIGKFAGLMAASSMHLETWARGKCSSFRLDTDLLGKYEGLSDMPITIQQCAVEQDKSGSRITLSDLHRHIAFPCPVRLKQLLIAEYGREESFHIRINNKQLDIDDLQGDFKENTFKSPKLGEVKMKCTISDQKRKLRKPGISIRVDGKIVGEPCFMGLDQSEDIPPKLLEKCYGEIQVDGLRDSVTADWGAIIDGSIGKTELQQIVQPELRKQLKSVYGQEMHLAQARLRKKAKDRISKLPENRREFADVAIRKILDRFYDEPEEKLEPVVNVLLDAMDRNDYRFVIEQIHNARRSDIAVFAEALEEFGFLELAMVAEQAKNRLRFLDYLEEICNNDSTLEAHVHIAIEKNIWLFGAEFSLFSSNITLKKQIESYLDRKYLGERKDKRPDLFLTENLNRERLLIEFKRPNHSLSYTDYQQATGYRNDFHQNGFDQQINVILIGGRFGRDLPIQERREPNVKIMLYEELISSARRQYQWLLDHS
ncbi:ATP-binding protein [Neptuniibacter sp. PT34_22]|uniref:ATP-binding protein n=1 Tax=Neptuniibacter sp. PT34_22 TaxID=3398205 RepID=UPI0039F4E2B4